MTPAYVNFRLWRDGLLPDYRPTCLDLLFYWHSVREDRQIQQATANYLIR